MRAILHAHLKLADAELYLERSDDLPFVPTVGMTFALDTGSEVVQEVCWLPYSNELAVRFATREIRDGVDSVKNMLLRMGGWRLRSEFKRGE